MLAEEEVAVLLDCTVPVGMVEAKLVTLLAAAAAGVLITTSALLAALVRILPEAVQAATALMGLAARRDLRLVRMEIMPRLGPEAAAAALTTAAQEGPALLAANGIQRTAREAGAGAEEDLLPLELEGLAVTMAALAGEELTLILFWALAAWAGKASSS
jgi:hypothetical protein